MSMASAAPIAWDIVEEHLDEASFLGSQWERGLDSHDVDLLQLAAGAERRFAAHIDALLVGGPAVAERVLLPALAEEHRPTCFAAALALLAVQGTREAVFAAWRAAQGPRQATLTRALAVSPAGVSPELRAAATDRGPAVRAAAIEVLGFHRALAPELAASLSGEREPAVRAALVIAAGRCGEPRLAQIVREELLAPTAPRAAEALKAAAILGLPEFPAACHDALARPDVCGDAALLLLALTPGPAHEAMLLAASERAPAIFALGFTGSLAAADRCLALAQAGRHVTLAFEAFNRITGAVLPTLPRPEEDPLPPLADDLAAPLADRPEDALPLPDVAAWTAWWAAQRGRLPAKNLPGQLGDRSAVLTALLRQPMRARHAVALRLAILTRGREQLETRASARRQLAELRRLGSG